MISLQEVIESSGYNLDTLEDSIWLLSKQNEFAELVARAELVIDQEQEKRDLAAEVEYESHFPKDEL